MIRKSASAISQTKKDIKALKDLKESAERKYKELDDVVFTENLKIIALIISFVPHDGRDGTIESSMYFDENWREETKDNPKL